MTLSPLVFRRARRLILAVTLALGASAAGQALADAPQDSPRPVPLTRPEMKRLIEDVKVRNPRIPLPELTAEQREQLGERADDYESVLRHCYTPWYQARRGPRPVRGSGASREQDPQMTLDFAFKTQLFWIVSRVNNCQYCIGHQESKLLGAGLTENQIAALDGDWSLHTPAERAAFAYARKLSHEPHLIGDADIEALRPYYTDLQILEMTLSVSRNNISNRWKEAIGVPQRADEGGYSRSDDEALPRGTYLTPTAPDFQQAITRVAPVVLDARTGKATRATVSRRTELESRAEIERSLEAARTRTPRLPLADEATARTVLSEHAPQGPLPKWMLLLANFPQEGPGYATTLLTAEEQGDLSPLLKAQLSWIIARHNRALYSLGDARQRLRQEGQSDDQIDALDGDWAQFSSRDQSLFTLAKKLAASPVILTDRDVARAVELAGPRDVVQTINYTTSRVFFDRFTEAAGLPLEE